MKKKKKAISVYNVLNHVLLIFFSVCCLLPFLLVLAVSFTDEDTIRVYGYSLIPKQFSVEAYQTIFKNPKEVINAYKVTILVTVMGTTLGTLFSTMISYALSRRIFKHRKIISLYVYIPMLFSAGTVPTYLVVAKYLNMKDTIWVLFLPILLSSWNIFILRTFFQDISESLYDSATVDGANEFKIFAHVAVPLGKVGIAIVALFSSLTLWNEWQLSMLYIDTGNVMTLQYMLQRIMNKINLAKEFGGTIALSLGKMPEENLRMALCVVAAGPMLFIFPFFQKYFAKGITLGSVKG